jgi:hypothetical protein
MARGQMHDADHAGHRRTYGHGVPGITTVHVRTAAHTTGIETAKVETIADQRAQAKSDAAFRPGQ